MSATIFWPAVYGWASGLIYRGKGLLTATSPWGAAPYDVPKALWIVAHTTHFTEPQTFWLLNASGSGPLGPGRTVTEPGTSGGFNTSYVTYVSSVCPDPRACPFTLVVESFLAGGVWHSSHHTAQPCPAPAQDPAQATFMLGGNLAGHAGGRLHVWHTAVNGPLFKQEADIDIDASGQFSVSVEPGAIYTFTTVESSHPGAEALMQSLQLASGASGTVSTSRHSTPISNNRAAVWDDGPVDAPFPLPHADDFEGYSNDTLPLFTSDMFGAWTVYKPAAGRRSETWPSSHTDLDLMQSPFTVPLRAAHPSPAVRAAVQCSTPTDAALRPSRCVSWSENNTSSRSPTTATNNAVLRQYTRAVPIGWGSSAANMATIIGNSTLTNIAVSVSALIESINPLFPAPQKPYVLLGIHGGQGNVGSTGPGSFYRQGPDMDFVWINVDGQWGCSFPGTPDVCASSYPLPSPFGYDTWHRISLASHPRPDGGSNIVVIFDSAVLANVTQTAAQVKNAGRGGYVGLVSGCHRTQWDNLLIESVA